MDDPPAPARGPTPRRGPGWWREAVVYEVYVRSFADGDGDGVGDLGGVTDRLPAIAELGVDALWLTPFYRSPQADHGYDVSDPRDVDPLFGDLAAFDRLVARAHGLGLRVVVDVVPNHVSDQHLWFREAVAAPPGAPARARFHVRAGRGPEGGEPPNGWTSVFGGPAWTRLPDGEWYLHLFAPEQPDLDWSHPDVRADLERTLRFWVARGVDGFRVDVAGGLAKDPDDEEVADEGGGAGGADRPHPHWDRPEVHDVYRSWRRTLDEAAPDVLGVAEVWGPPARTAAYARQDELGQAFAFALLDAPWDAAALHEALEAQLAAHAAVGALPAWVLGSHDFVRAATRRGTERSLALHLLLLAMPGAFYLYAGDELGLPQADVPRSRWQDPQALRSGGALPSRDGARVPLPWEAAAGPAGGFGFSAGTPWLPVPESWRTLARDAQRDDPSSPWSVLRRALAVRRDLWVGAPREVTWLRARAGLLVGRRGRGVVVLSTAGGDVPLDGALAGLDGELRPVASSRGPVDGAAGVVRPSTCLWFEAPGVG